MVWAVSCNALLCTASERVPFAALKVIEGEVMESPRQHDLNSLCRTCLQNLSEEDAESGSTHEILQTPELAKRLMVCAAVQVEPDDDYPKHLCGSCYCKVNEFHEFRSMCVESMERLREALQSRNAGAFEDEKPDFDIVLATKTEITVDEGVVLFSEGASDGDALKLGRREPRRRGRATTSSQKCQSNEAVGEFRNAASEIRTRSVVQAEKREAVGETLQQSAAVGELPDNFDDNASEDSGSADSHLSEQHESEDEELIAIATKCSRKKDKNAVVEGQRKSKRHKSSSERQAKSKQFQCDLCPARFFVEHRLLAHKRAHAGLTPYPCSRADCDKSFNRWHCLAEHLKQHEGTNRWYSCDVDGCDKVYKHKPTLVMHQRKYHKRGPELKSHVCEVCGKVFKASAILNDHRYTHKDKSELPHVCDQPNCSRRFSNKEKLKVHLMRHAGIKNFVCPYCGMRKTTRNELNIHINYHTLERTWPCRFCAHVCNSAGNLRMHVRTVHERAKDYACRHCDRTFAKPDTRKYHEMTHTGEKPNECKECGKRFTQPAALRTHRKIHQRQRMQSTSGDDMHGIASADASATEQQQQCMGINTPAVVVLQPSAQTEDANETNARIVGCQRQHLNVIDD